MGINEDRFMGSILAGAVGDALGAPVEFDIIESIRERFGPAGTTGFAEEYGGRGTITDDTQMTLFTLEGLIRGHRGTHDDLFAPMQHAYQRWAAWVVRQSLNNSKGCGAVMRAAPMALLGDDAFAFAVGMGLLTHGHPSGVLSAGALAHLVLLLLWDVTLPDAAVELAAEGPTPETIEARLGGGWKGEEALAIAVCCALAASDMRHGLLLAVNHSGDSDSTGAICGNILGAIQGTAAIPAEWLAELELRDVIEQVTRDALAEFGENPPEWGDRYPTW